MTAEVICGDCLDVMPTMEADSVDAIVSDPPYGLSFMGKHWDHGVPGVDFWMEAKRVAKPGSYLLAFGGTRTFHRLAVAIEDAGFEVQDCLSWLYGSGFPKHKSKLKPAWEPIIMARKPAPKATLLNIDACRIGTSEPTGRPQGSDIRGGAYVGSTRKSTLVTGGSPLGRWPANVLLDEEAAAVLDEQSGISAGGTRREGIARARMASWHEKDGRKTVNSVTSTANSPDNYGDSGGASRFFYTAKASRSERNAGLEGFEKKAHLIGAAGHKINPMTGREVVDVPRANHHPTVKPVELMRWLCRLVTPANGLILDPFCGSGSTGVAATLEAFRFLGIEKESEYAEIARRRIAETPPSLFGEVA